MSDPRPNGASWLSPYITVTDVAKILDFYKRAFTFEIKNTAPGEDGIPIHAELTYQNQLMMCGKQGAYNGKTLSPLSSGVESPIGLYLYCHDVDAFYKKAVSEGAESMGAPEDMFWGDRMCRLKDPEHYIWCFATHTKK